MNKQHFDEIRMKRNVSLEKLSELTLIPISTLSKISAGKIQTSFENMCRIANALECSLDYFADNHHSYPSLISEDFSFIKQFHSLSSQNQHAIDMIFKMEKNCESSIHSNTRGILCYIPILCDDDCFFQNCLAPATIFLPTIYRYPEADFAWKITNSIYTPYFFQSDILLFKHRNPVVEEIALFQQDERIFLRRYILVNHTPMLQSIQPEKFPLELLENKKCRCIGTLHSIIRANSPLAKRITLTLS